MDFRARIIAELDANKARTQLQSLTKEQTVDLAVDVAIKNAKALDNLKTDAASLQKTLSKNFNIKIDNKQAMQAIKQVQSETVKAQKQLVKEQQQAAKQQRNLSSSYYKQLFDNQFNDRYTKSSELQKMADYYANMEKEALRMQHQVQNIQKRVSQGFLDVDVSNVQKNLKKYAGVDSSTLKEVENSYQRLINLQKELQTGMNNGTGTKLSDTEFVDKYNQFSDVLQKCQNQMKVLSNEASGLARPFNSLDAITASNKTLTWLNNNTKAAKDYGDALEQLAAKQRSATSTSELRQYNKEFRNIVSEAQLAGKTGKSFVDDFGRAFGQIFQFAGAYGMIQNVIFDVPRQMWQAVRDVDDAMTNLQMATGVSNDRAKELMSTYAQLGDQLKATSTDVAASATEWLKQGQSIEDSNTLAEYSTILSKIGDLSSEDATSTITAAMKSYDLGVDDVMDFVDQISAVDLVSATDVGGLATAFNEVAANARQAGVSTEELLSYAAAIGETTQEGMASVGTSLNAIFSRMGNIKLSRLKDYETGEDLSNVETVLRGVGISLRDTQDEFREFDEVLDETAGRWNSFSGVQQRAVAQAFAGTNHMNEFMVLMQQWENVEKYITEADNASGQSMEKYEAYTDSLAGKIEGFTNSFQAMSSSILNSDVFGILIDGASGFLNVLTQIINVGGGLPVVLGAIGGTALFKNLDEPENHRVSTIINFLY